MALAARRGRDDFLGVESFAGRGAGPRLRQHRQGRPFFVYGLLATLTARLGRNRRAAWLALLAVSAFGVTDEFHQSFVPGRSCSAADWVADTLGAALAVGCYAGWERYRRLLELPLVRPARS